MTESLILDRPPRIQPELPSDTIEIPPPPTKDSSGIERLIQVGLPVITILGYLLMSSLGGSGRSPWLMIPMALSVIASTIFSLYSYRKEKQRQAEIEKAYSERLVELNRDMHEYHDQQRRFYNYNYPDRGKLFTIVLDAKEDLRTKQRRLRSEARIYERRVEDADFAALRLGMGTLPSTVLYVLKDAENFEDKQVREAMKLQEESKFVSNIPVIVNLRNPHPDALPDEEKEEDVTPFSHAVGVAGERASVQEFVRFLLAQYAVFHAPGDAKLYVLGNQREEWKWIKNLPHSQNDEHNQYLCFAEDYAGKTGGSIFDENAGSGVDIFLEGLRSTLAQRKIRLQDREEEEKSGGGYPRQPFMLVVVDLLDAFDALNSPLKDLEADAAISILLEEGANLGAAILFLVPERSKVPGKCRSIIEIERTTPATNSRSQKYLRLHFRYAEVGVNSYRYVGKADRVEDWKHCAALATELSRMEVKQGYGANLISSLSFLDLMNVPTLSALLEESQDWWQESIEPEHANWLRVKFARMSGNKDRTLVFSAKQDGVHGMIAGSTGSGKSEILISMITGMAVTYHPNMLNFVLVDYKGGGAFAGIFNDEWKLPHCVDLITNLQGNSVTRMFTAINAELHRRQKLLVDRGTKHIVEYYERGLHNDLPLPFLFIIIDEFAEMIADRSEYKTQLESITRIGRSLGVSLILAAQNPSGVTDQMRSNIKFRICLRVETSAQSRELLRKTDAAFLPSIPGRGYLQVGNDEIELIQVAYTGEKFQESDAESALQTVLWPDHNKSDYETDEPLELYKVIAQRLQDQAISQHVAPQRAPWPDFLPDRLALNQPLAYTGGRAIDRKENQGLMITSTSYLQKVDLLSLDTPQDDLLTLNPFFTNWTNEPESAGWNEQIDWITYAMRPVVGLIDDPYGARQIPLCVDLYQGHAVLYGASGWGKSAFIRTLALSLAATHSPNRLHMYILDLGGRTLSALAGLPHVGSVISPDEEGYEERVAQLLRVLDETINDRKEVMSAAEAANIYEYNAWYPEQCEPSILVAIDNFFEFRETFGGDADDENSVLAKLITIARQARPYGIHFVITASQPGVLNNQLASIFTEKLTLKLNDPGEYRAIVGGAIEDIEGIPGRGYVQVDRVPLAFQVALPFDASQQGEDGQSDSERTQEFIHNMALYVDEREGMFSLPKPIKALPQSILFRHLLARQHDLGSGDGFLTELERLIQTQWKESTQPERADWLSVTLGVILGDRPKTLEFEAKKDGVHGLIAGGTGAGKSELLMTLIVGLAFRYDPSILNFVLVDYKGGGAFQPFADLPHCVDIVTNLNKSAVVRMFTAIRAEMQRRQKLNKDTDTKDIIEYRRQGLHRKGGSHSYPHLFVIIDEYAEMITDTPEFRDELESITRIGRSIGVNLLLASQRPIGVTDQMRANIKYRICLRVEQADTSREMLRRADAALLPSGMPGRGYLQVGNEHIELLQVAYTGDDVAEAAGPDGKPLKFYEYAVDVSNRIWGRQHATKLGAPWPPILSNVLTFSTPVPRQYVTDRSDEERMDDNGQGDWVLNAQIERWTEPASNGAEISGPDVGWKGVNWREMAMQAVVGLLDDPFESRLRPLIVDLTQGHGIIFGGSGWGKTTFLRSLILSLAATHSPKELHIHILDMGGRSLEALSALPQVGTIILPDECGYEERIQQILRELHDLIDQRRRHFSEAGVADFYEYNQTATRDANHTIEPAILFVLDNFTEFIETFGNRPDQDDRESIFGSFIALARQGKSYGVHIFVSASQVKSISSKLYSLFTERYTLRLSDTGEYSAIVGGRVEEVDSIPGRGYTRVGRRPLGLQVALHPGSVDPKGEYIGGDRQLIVQMCEQMKQAIARSGLSYTPPLKIDALPPSSLYRTLLAEEYHLPLDEYWWDGLKEHVHERWATNSLAEKANWLQVPIGVISGNRKRTIHFEAQMDGVHGMIAGGTGSGKSELLMTLIVGLALNYSPEILNFILVDFKGGGAFKPFENLPHCVDIVTNLNASAVDRMFTAINAEMKRRQALNRETDTKDIIEYRRKGLHKINPYPHLFVIIDEYAEMIENNPDYRAELESITRVGRAQGVNLILASQKPKGVSDQMRANIKLRICLRVEDQDTSREMLRRPDAALLPNGMPGRGYLQVGNENIELIQVSWTGDTVARTAQPGIEWPDRIHDEADTPEASPQAEEKIPFFEHTVRLVNELWQEQFVPKPWPGFLPNLLSLQNEIIDSKTGEKAVLNRNVSNWLNGEPPATLWPGINWHKTAFSADVGLVDDPALARQLPLSVDFKSNHLVIMGDGGYGKTGLMRTVLIGLGVTHSPQEFHSYIVDMSGRNYSSVESLPHVGSVIYGDEERFDERLNRLLALLEKTQRTRQQLLGGSDAPSIYAYNQQHPENVQPLILVMIDNFAALQSDYEFLVDTTLLPLVRTSAAVGIAFVVSANQPNDLPSKLYNLFGQRLTFHQTNRDRYPEIAGRGALDLDDIPGRGYIRLGNRPLQFQAAMPVGLPVSPDENALNESQELRWMAECMQRWVVEAQIPATQLPTPIQTLEEHIQLAELLADVGTHKSSRIQAVLGKNDDLLPALIDLERMGPHFAVLGQPLSGKTTTLYSWVLSLAHRYDPSQVAFVLVDMRSKFADYGGDRTLAELPHVLRYVSDSDEITELTEQLLAEAIALQMKKDGHHVFVIIDNFDDFSHELERSQDAARDLAGIARRYGQAGIHFVAAGAMSNRIELLRQITASNYGVVLRTADLLSNLRVLKMPRNAPGQLPIGRGYFVRSGQPGLIQIASPYPAMDADELDDVIDENRCESLDEWVEKICNQYPNQRSAWSTTGDGQTTDSTPTELSPQHARMLGLVNRIMQAELQQLANGDSKQRLITSQILSNGIGNIPDEDTLVDLIRQKLLANQAAKDIPVTVTSMLFDSYKTEDLLVEAERTFPNMSIDEQLKSD